MRLVFNFFILKIYCNIRVKRTCPNAVGRLGWATSQATLRVKLIINWSDLTLTCGYVGVLRYNIKGLLKNNLQTARSLYSGSKLMKTKSREKCKLLNCMLIAYWGARFLSPFLLHAIRFVIKTTPLLFRSRIKELWRIVNSVAELAKTSFLGQL